MFAMVNERNLELQRDADMLKELIAEAVENEPPKEWPTYDGKILPREEYLSASEVASCLRMTYFNKYPSDQFPSRGYRSNGYAERGHAIEAHLVSKLRNTTARLDYAGDNQVSFYSPEQGISGTPDGLLQLPSGEWVLIDFKSIDPRTNRNNLPKKKHVWQVNQNIYLVNMCAPEYKVKRAFLYYIDASDIYDIQEEEIQYDLSIIQEVLERANRLWIAKDGDELPPEGIINDDCDFCPHHARCSAFVDLHRQVEVAKVGSGGFLQEIVDDDQSRDLIRLLSLRRMAKALEKDIDTLTPAVRKLLKSYDGEVIVEGEVLTYQEYPGRETLDKKAMVAAGIDIEPYTKIGKPYGVIRSKKLKGTD